MIEEYFVVVVAYADYEINGSSTVSTRYSGRYKNYPTVEEIQREMLVYDIVIEGRRAMKPLYAKVEKRYFIKGN